MSTASQADHPANMQDEEPPITGELVAGPASTELAVSAMRHAIIKADNPAEILTKAGTIAASLKDLIQKQGLSLRVNGKEHVEIGGWQACGALVGTLGGIPLHADTRWGPRRVTDSDVEEYEACVEIRTLEGVVVGSAVGSCSRAESKWSSRDTYALRSMAETRAESRAYRRAVGWLVNIAGYSTTPAEEMPEHQTTSSTCPFGPALTGSKAQQRPYGQAFERLVGPDAKTAWVAIIADLGYMPKAVADAFALAARFLPSETEEAVAV